MNWTYGYQSQAVTPGVIRDHIFGGNASVPMARQNILQKS
jgi:hypothetical protein